MKSWIQALPSVKTFAITVVACVVVGLFTGKLVVAFIIGAAVLLFITLTNQDPVSMERFHSALDWRRTKK